MFESSRPDFDCNEKARAAKQATRAFFVVSGILRARLGVVFDYAGAFPRTPLPLTVSVTFSPSRSTITSIFSPGL